MNDVDSLVKRIARAEKPSDLDTELNELEMLESRVGERITELARSEVDLALLRGIHIRYERLTKRSREIQHFASKLLPDYGLEDLRRTVDGNYEFVGLVTPEETWDSITVGSSLLDDGNAKTLEEWADFTKGKDSVVLPVRIRGILYNALYELRDTEDERLRQLVTELKGLFKADAESPVANAEAINGHGDCGLLGPMGLPDGHILDCYIPHCQKMYLTQGLVEPHDFFVWKVTGLDSERANEVFSWMFDTSGLTVETGSHGVLGNKAIVLTARAGFSRIDLNTYSADRDTEDRLPARGVQIKGEYHPR